MTRAALAPPLIMVLIMLAAGCGTQPAPTPFPTPSEPTPTPTSASPVTNSPTTVPEPTTTNTLPPPPPATAAAPTRSGTLTARSLPVPAGWRTVAPTGSEEDGYLGNGTWVLGRDPRYAAQDAITMGCAPVTRDDYPDPNAALEGHYERRGQPGVAVTLHFADAGRAAAYLRTYRRQVSACTDPDVLRARIEDSAEALVDRRSYGDGSEWTEVTRQVGPRVTIMLLGDPGHVITDRQITAISAQIRTHSTR